MNINEKDIITLSNDIDYIVVKKINYNNLNYYYVADIKKTEDVKFLYEDNNEFVEIEDKNHINTLVNIMLPDIDLDVFLEELKRRIDVK